MKRIPEDFSGLFGILIAGAATEEETTQCLMRLGLSESPVHSYAVALFTIENTSLLQPSRFRLPPDYIRRQWDNLDHDTYEMAYGNAVCDVFAVIQLPKSEAEHDTKLQAILSELVRRLRYQTEQPIQCRLSALLAAPKEIGIGYNQIHELSNYLCLTERTGLLITYSEVCARHPKCEIYGIESRYSRVLSALSVNDFTAVQTVLNEMIDEDYKPERFTVQMTDVMKYTLLNFIRITMEHMQMIVGLPFFDDCPINLWGVVYKNSLNEIRDGMNEIFARYFSYVEDCKQEKTPVWSTLMKEYIQVHLSDTNLSVTSIADYLGLNAVYVGRTFKKLNNIQLNDYIHQLRLENALKLMRGNMTLKEIAKAVGYDSVIRFRMACKRYMGKTPSELRDLQNAGQVSEACQGRSVSE